MTKQLLCVCLTLCTVFYAQCSGDPPKIINGEEVNPKFQYPWMAALTRGTGWAFCGGTVVGPKYVMTAAHCTPSTDSWDDPVNAFDPNGEAMYVEAYRHDMREPSNAEPPNDPVRHAIAAKNRVTAVHWASRNAGRASPADADVAILEVEREYPPMVYENIKLNDDPSVLQAGTPVRFLGWGTMWVDGAGPATDLLQTVVLPIVGWDDCNNRYADWDGIGEKEYCAGAYGAVNQDTCFGDSGGPSFIMDGNTHVIIGIESYGRQECAVENGPGVKESVAHHIEWIRKALAGEFDDGNDDDDDEDEEDTTKCTKAAGSNWKAKRCKAKCNNANRCLAQCGRKCSQGCKCVNKLGDTACLGKQWKTSKCRRKCNNKDKCPGKCTKKRCGAGCVCTVGRRLMLV